MVYQSVVAMIQSVYFIPDALPIFLMSKSTSCGII
jgi:hypothetical protein